MEWHLKNAHAMHDHSEASEAAAAASRLAIVPHRTFDPFALLNGPEGEFGKFDDGGARVAAGGGSEGYDAPGTQRTHRLDPTDVTIAQRDPETAARMISEGRIQSLGPGLDACRAGDLATLRALVLDSTDPWDPTAPGSRDKHGASGMLWAAGGGHLECCRFLRDECGLDPNPDSERAGGGDGGGGAVQHARRGYNGRTALHYAARNGHVEVLRWLIDECGCDPGQLSLER